MKILNLIELSTEMFEKVTSVTNLPETTLVFLYQPK